MGNSGKNIALHTLWQDYLQGTLVNTINEIAGAVVDFSALVFGLLKWLNSSFFLKLVQCQPRQNHEI